MNRRQLTFVLAGLLIFLVGAFVGLTPVHVPDSDGVAVVLPLAQPVEAVAVRPRSLLLALGVSVLGIAVALVGCYTARDRG